MSSSVFHESATATRLRQVKPLLQWRMAYGIVRALGSTGFLLSILLRQALTSGHGGSYLQTIPRNPFYARWPEGIIIINQPKKGATKGAI